MAGSPLYLLSSDSMGPSGLLRTESNSYPGQGFVLSEGPMCTMLSLKDSPCRPCEGELQDRSMAAPLWCPSSYMARPIQRGQMDWS